MGIVNFVITFVEIIAAIAATELEISSCQPNAREQQMRRGYTHQFYRGPKPDHIYRGTGSAYRNGTTGSYLTCAGMCLWDDACKSFNFCQDAQRCELNSAVYFNTSELLFFSGCLYFDEEYHTPEAEDPPAVCLSPEPLGLEDGTIPDDHITASSEQKDWPVSDARLKKASGWSAHSDDANSWIEVDLDDIMIVYGVITQGDNGGFWVKKYKVLYARPPSSSASEYVTDANGDVQIFVGNVNDNNAVTNMFHQSIVATTVRIEVVKYRNGVGMRLELLGCRN